MDFTFVKVHQKDTYEENEILFSTTTLEKFSLEQLFVLNQEVRERIKIRVKLRELIEG